MREGFQLNTLVRIEFERLISSWGLSTRAALGTITVIDSEIMTYEALRAQ